MRLLTDEHGKILLLRRSLDSKNFRHQWDLPGGKVDPSEPFDAALVREVAEETGLAIEIAKLAGATEFALPAVHVVMLILEARRTAGEVRLSQEHDDYVRVDCEEACTLDLTDPLRRFFGAYCARCLPQPES